MLLAISVLCVCCSVSSFNVANVGRCSTVGVLFVSRVSSRTDFCGDDVAAALASVLSFFQSVLNGRAQKRAASKLEEIHSQTNGMSQRLEAVARAAGKQEGLVEGQKLKGEG